VPSEKKRLRSAFSFTLSALLHGSVLAWVALGSLIPETQPGSAYDQLIRPKETKLVWYDFRKLLPEITPPHRDPRPPRANSRSPQTLVAGPQDTQSPPQLIWTPAPEIAAQPIVPAPNIVALVAPARPVKPFSTPADLIRREAPATTLPDAPSIAVAEVKPVDFPPPELPRRAFTPPPELIRNEAPATTLPDAPRLALAELKPVALAPPERARPRAFTPPPEKQPAARPALLAAPEITVALDRKSAGSSLLPPIQPARKTFIPPLEAPHASPTETARLPAAPQVATHAVVSSPALPGATMARAVRPFTAPVEAKRALSAQPANLPAAPQIAAPAPASSPVLPATAMARAVRPFAAPEKKPSPETKRVPSLADAPTLSSANRNSDAAFAIVGLFPTRTKEIPAPKASQQAGFSAGPNPRRDGGDSTVQPGQLTVPGLLARTSAPEPQPKLTASLEAPTSSRNLAVAARSVQAVGTPAEPEIRVTPTAPDPRLAGRVVYTVAIQMPNITSYSGSWIVWFAESEPLRGRELPVMRPPRPLRKVDPKYTPAAADEKVEGKVRLAAIIRKNGHVEQVELLRHLDSRLDQSSAEALAKWEFEPATRNGIPIDVDAVFEIPFHIAPKSTK
jgi:TonB family protein